MNDKLTGKHSPWLLPDAVEELLPPDARALEHLRRTSLDTCEYWGYALVMPPVIEYLEALLSGVAHDLDLQTFKLTDQLSGRMMGVRADITPQAARIDAHQLRREGPVRLCYTGTVLRTRPEAPGGARNPLQLGAELYGHAGIESDVEIISLMAEVLAAAGVGQLHLDLGHVGIFRGLAAQAALSTEAESALWDALQRKATADIAALLDEYEVPSPQREHLSVLAQLSGGVEVLDEARSALAGANGVVNEALDALSAIAQAISQWLPDLTLHIDLGELRGYRYHTGVVFAAYTPGVAQELARGGRYDDIGAVFGRARPATGFSTDLKALYAAVRKTPSEGDKQVMIAAPWGDDPALHAQVKRLRDAGNTVLWLLSGTADEAREQGCHRMLVAADAGDWQIVDI